MELMLIDRFSILHCFFYFKLCISLQNNFYCI
ncbi:putative proline-rich receptor-like protein kinase PERK3 [Iris pallida]|uniref:Proline-rich receptor-like protein kinase PERK3 n=1 Tax=Iris pallida TaxID=29817 RepID=A0AAX6F7B6_IRIPA|nr:putative proline-rich receptor-like protein kinase PERK3 [Iris pallida]